MRLIFTEKNLVVVLFVLVLITFALAQEDSKKMEKAYTGIHAESAAKLASITPIP
jgi:hypothetical protein